MKLLVAAIVFVLVYAVQRYLFGKYWYRGLDSEVRFSRDYIECGESAELIEVITNDKLMPLPVFHLKFSVDKSLMFDDTANSNVTDLYHKNELFSMLGHQRVTRRLTFVGSSRGAFSIKNASVLVRDYFMTDSYAAMLRKGKGDAIYVFPKKINTDRFELIFRGILGEIEAKQSIVEDSLSFRGIREYQPFDSYRSINWKQSAKARDLMVNMYGYTTDSRVKILVNLDNDYMIETNQLLEEAISLASSIARRLLDKGVMVSIVTNGVNEDGELLLPVEEGAERRHGVTIDRMLTEIESSEGKDVFLDIIDKELDDIRSDILYLVISPYAKVDLLEKLDMIQGTDSSVHLIVPCYDEYPYIPNREYAESWEVPLNV